MLDNWPNNFLPHYIGISESYKSGVKSRLSSHYRRKGNKCIAKLLSHKKTLYYICIYGKGTEQYEALFLCLQNETYKQLTCNIRDENRRNSIRIYKEVKQGMSGFDKSYFDNLD